MLVSICSLLSACGAKVERPDANASWIHARSLKTVTYNLKTDYDQFGNRLPDAKPVVTGYMSCEAMIEALSVSVCFDPKGQKEVKRALDESQKYMELLKEKCGSKCWGL